MDIQSCNCTDNTISFSGTKDAEIHKGKHLHNKPLVVGREGKSRRTIYRNQGGLVTVIMVGTSRERPQVSIEGRLKLEQECSGC